jgi:hypothetical protein
MAGTVTEIGIQRAFDRGAAGKNGGPELLEVGPSFPERRRSVPHEGGALAGKDLVRSAAGHGGNTRHGFLPDFVAPQSAH